MPPPSLNPAAMANLAKLLIGGTALAWGASNSLFNVEGGHRAIVFNRLVGIKEEVRSVPESARGTALPPGAAARCCCGTSERASIVQPPGVHCEPCGCTAVVPDPALIAALNWWRAHAGAVEG